MGVQQIEHDQGSSKLRWDDLRTLLITAECGSFRAASELLGSSANTVRNRIAALEQTVGHLLLARSVEGVTPTEEGQKLLRIADRMRRASLEADALIRRSGDAVQGEVSIAVTEGLGTFWLVPRTVEFHRDHPGLTLNLQCSMQAPDLLRHEADMAIQLDRPNAPDLIATRVGYLHLMPFASEEYLRLKGAPRSIEEWRDHHFVEQRAPQVRSEFLEAFVPGAKDVPGFISIRTNTSSAHYWAVAKGGGIGILPTYIRAISKKVRPVDMNLKLRREIWLVYHPTAKSTRKIELTIRWLRAAFNSAQHPWFGEEFIHPHELDRFLNKSTVINLFEGFLEEPHVAHRQNA